MLVLTTVVTLFVIMLLGVATRLFNIIDWQTTKRLSGFLVNVTQPLLIICSFQTDFSGEKLKIALAILAASAVIHIAFSFLARILYRGSEKATRSVYEFGLIFANCAYLGYPVLGAIFGQDGYFYGAVFTLFFNVYIRVYGVFLLSKGKKNNHALRNALLNTGTIASAIGILLFAFSIKLPAFLLDSFTLVGDMTFPLSMIVVGSLLCNKPFLSNFKISLFTFSFAKLILLPTITLAVCVLLHTLFGMELNLTYICVVMAAMPTAANTAIFAELYKADSSTAASCVGISTMLSVFTIPLMIYLTSLVLSFL